ncbi:MAG: HipA domain-containing protein [Myxococcaceae bacterium]
MSWTKVALKLHADGRLLEGHARTARWLDTFGQLIGNTDRHLGNLSVFSDSEPFTLTPVYDMLPMMFAPAQTQLPKRTFMPQPPNSENADVWASAANVAQDYWSELIKTRALSANLKAEAKKAQRALSAALEQFA